MNEKVPAGWTFAIDDKAEQMPTPTQQPDPKQVHSLFGLVFNFALYSYIKAERRILSESTLVLAFVLLFGRYLLNWLMCDNA